LLSEITVTPPAGAFMEIYNPNSSTVDLTDIYILPTQHLQETTLIIIVLLQKLMLEAVALETS
jgi:hypothetical protein